MSTEIAIFWHRRDIRNNDNAGLYHALKSGLPVLPLFIFDKNILDKLEDKEDKRVTFIHEQIAELKSEYHQLGTDIQVEYGDPMTIWQNIDKQYQVKKVFTNHDYEPYATERDEQVKKILATKGIEFLTFKDQCIFEKEEVTKDDGKPYTVFTPYSKKWKAKLNDYYLKAYPTEKYFQNFYKIPNPQT